MWSEQNNKKQQHSLEKQAHARQKPVCAFRCQIDPVFNIIQTHICHIKVLDIRIWSYRLPHQKHKKQAHF